MLYRDKAKKENWNKTDKQRADTESNLVLVTYTQYEQH